MGQTIFDCCAKYQYASPQCGRSHALVLYKITTRASEKHEKLTKP